MRGANDFDVSDIKPAPFSPPLTRDVSESVIANLFACASDGRSCPWGAVPTMGRDGLFWYRAKERSGNSWVPWGTPFRPEWDDDQQRWVIIEEERAISDCRLRIY